MEVCESIRYVCVIFLFFFIFLFRYKFIILFFDVVVEVRMKVFYIVLSVYCFNC